MKKSNLDPLWVTDCTHSVLCTYTDDDGEVVVYCPDEKEIEHDAERKETKST